MLRLIPSRLLPAGLIALAALFTAQVASAQLLRSEDKYASITTNGFTIYNNVWGWDPPPGPQQLWVYGYNNWGVKAYHTNLGIKSYPNVSKYIGRQLSSIAKLDGKFTASTPSGGAWAVTYDIWDKAKGEEVMLWFNHTGDSDGGGLPRPISARWGAAGNALPALGSDGRELRNIYIGYNTWNIYRGKNGNINVYSLVRTSKTNSAYVDIREILNFLRTDSRTRWIGDFTLGDVQHGFEITSCGSSATNRAEFKFTSYDLWQ